MTGSKQNYILWTALLISLLSPSIKSISCPNRDFKDWLGKSYTISSKEVCTFSVIGVCFTSKCKVSTDIFNAAISSTGWDWDNLSCNEQFKVGSEGSDDMECSNPQPDPVHESLFNDVCKIHDMCLKTDGRTAMDCHEDFTYNMRKRCELQYPDIDTYAAKMNCFTAAGTWSVAVKAAGSHHGGINEAECKSKCNWGCYLSRYADLRKAYGSNLADAEQHYYKYGRNECRNCKCSAQDNCNWNCYLNRYSDLRKAFGSDEDKAADHYEKYGKGECRNCKCSDDRCDWGCYLDRYQDLKKAFGDNEDAAAQHWDNYGKKEGRNCVCNQCGCNWCCYLERYDDLQRAFGDNEGAAESHYSKYGKNEGRDCKCSDSMAVHPEAPQKRIKFKPVNNVPYDPSPSPSNWKIDVSTSWIAMIGALLAIVLIFNICVLILRNSGRKKVYASIKGVDSEYYDTENERNPINI